MARRKHLARLVCALLEDEIGASWVPLIEAILVLRGLGEGSIASAGVRLVARLRLEGISPRHLSTLGHDAYCALEEM